MSNPKNQVGGRVELPLAIVGSRGLGSNQQHERIFTPEDAEFQYYQELFKFFFAKFTKWNDIIAPDENDNVVKPGGYGQGYTRWINIFRSTNGLFITYDMNTMLPPSDKVLQMRSSIGSGHMYQLSLSHAHFIIRPGLAGKHLLTDPEDGKPLEEVEINVDYQSHIPVNSIKIKTIRPGEKTGGRRNYRQTDYDLYENTLEVSHKFSWFDVMTDAMATSLINTIDALIPGAQPPPPQNERRTTPEMQIAKALPAPGRRAAL